MQFLITSMTYHISHSAHKIEFFTRINGIAVHILGYIPFGSFRVNLCISLKIKLLDFQGKSMIRSRPLFSAREHSRKVHWTLSSRYLCVTSKVLKKGLFPQIPNNEGFDKFTYSGEVYRCIVVFEVILSYISWC